MWEEGEKGRARLFGGEKKEGEKIGSRVARKRLVPNQGGSDFFSPCCLVQYPKLAHLPDRTLSSGLCSWPPVEAREASGSGRKVDAGAATAATDNELWQPRAAAQPTRAQRNAEAEATVAAKCGERER